MAEKKKNENPSGIAGSINLSDEVVATVAGLAAKEIEGIYSVGKTPLINLSNNPSRGVGVEVGEKQAAFDLDVVIEYGNDIRKVAKELREKTAVEVEKMTGRQVIEINIHVVDIKLPDEIANNKSRVI